jgi:hypothetical protein
MKTTNYAREKKYAEDYFIRTYNLKRNGEVLRTIRYILTWCTGQSGDLIEIAYRRLLDYENLHVCGKLALDLLAKRDNYRCACCGDKVRYKSNVYRVGIDRDKRYPKLFDMNISELSSIIFQCGSCSNEINYANRNFNNKRNNVTKFDDINERNIICLI